MSKNKIISFLHLFVPEFSYTEQPNLMVSTGWHTKIYKFGYAIARILVLSYIVRGVNFSRSCSALCAAQLIDHENRNKVDDFAIAESGLLVLPKQMRSDAVDNLTIALPSSKILHVLQLTGTLAPLICRQTN